MTHVRKPYERVTFRKCVQKLKSVWISEDFSAFFLVVLIWLQTSSLYAFLMINSDMLKQDFGITTTQVLKTMLIQRVEGNFGKQGIMGKVYNAL